MTETRSRSTLVSISIHAALIALLLSASKQIAVAPAPETRTDTVTLLAPVLPHPSLANAGGGGQHALAPATAGRLPRAAPKPFIAPTVQTNPAPRLVVDPSIEGAPELKLVENALPNLGDPLSAFKNSSGGMGGPAGIGNGKGRGVGNGDGASAGDGDSGNGTVYRAGNGVTRPVLVHQVSPEFSEEARRAKYSGSVRVYMEIDRDGRPRNIRLDHSLGLGLDEKAIEAVRQWLFKPGTKNGMPVVVSAVVDVSFRLL